jgi:hypothetical protein
LIRTFSYVEGGKNQGNRKVDLLEANRQIFGLLGNISTTNVHPWAATEGSPYREILFDFAIALR